MPSNSRYLFVPVLALGLVLASCSRPDPDARAAALGAEIDSIRALLPADPSGDQVGQLAKPAKRAAAAYAELCELSAEHPGDTCVADSCRKAEPVAVEIRRIHRLATERHDLAELMGGLKVRGYRAARTVVVPKLLAGVSSAARQAAETEIEKLPPLVRQMAELAAALAGSRPAEAADQPAAAPLTRADWLRAAERIDAFNRQEPAEVGLALAATYASLGRYPFALAELDRLDPAGIGNPEWRPLVPLLRAVVFSRLGYLELAAREAATISGDTETGRQLLAAIHAALAYCHAADKDWKQMDRNLAEAVRVWPDNPLVVFLTGERLLADGRKEQALEAFSRVAAGTEAAWLAPLLEQRIRAVRDAKGEVPPLLLDNRLFVHCLLHALATEAHRTELGRSITHLLALVRLLPDSLEPEPN